MKRISIILFLLLSTISLSATSQQNNNNTAHDHIFVEVETQAAFPGGQRELMQWIKDNLRYPESALENHLEGKVIVKFTIEKDGSVTEPKVVRGVNDEFDAEALRLVKLMPKWQPGTNNGVPVKSYFTMPFIFRLPKQ